MLPIEKKQNTLIRKPLIDEESRDNGSPNHSNWEEAIREKANEDNKKLDALLSNGVPSTEEVEVETHLNDELNK